MNGQFRFLFLVTIVILLDVATAKNILFFVGVSSYSHKAGLWPLAAALAQKGHNVTVLSGIKKQPFKEPLIHDLVSTTLDKFMSAIRDVNRFQSRIDGTHHIFEHCDEASIKAFDFMAQSDGDVNLQNIAFAGNFDLVITNLVFSEFGYVIAHHSKAKVILYMPAFLFGHLRDEFGLPDETGSIPDMRASDFLTKFPMGFSDRVWNFITPIKWFLNRRLNVYPRFEAAISKLYGLKNHETPHFPELIRNTSLILLNSHHTVDFPHSLPPFVVSMGGMQCWLPEKPLPKEFQNILDKATDGAVLISFGSGVNPATMPSEIKSIFFSLMRNFPSITFIWRWEGPIPEEKFENAAFYKWIPQLQVLGHKNMKAFISHAGLNSVMEATYHGVPLILIPLFADQNYNSFRVEDAGTGIRLELAELTTSKLIHGVTQVLYNPQFAENMKDMSKIFKDRPKNPIDTAVYWTEFVLKHEDFSSLKPLQNVTWFQRKLWDAFLILILAAAISLLAVLKLCAYCHRAWITKRSNLEEDKKKTN